MKPSQSAFFSRRQDGPLQTEMYLVCSIGTILIIRTGLYMTGYPQLGGGGLHIAHMLWGGLLMFASQVLHFCFIGKQLQRLSAVLGGIGFGTFIDELGKFVTSDNDYFFRPTATILYVLFCSFFVVLKVLEPQFESKNMRRDENLVNALEVLASIIDSKGITKESKALVLEFLQHADQNHPLVTHISSYIDELSIHEEDDAQHHFYLRLRKSITSVYSSVVMHPYTFYAVNTFFLTQSLLQVADVTVLLVRETKSFSEDFYKGSTIVDMDRQPSLLRTGTDMTKLHIVQFSFMCVSALFVFIGVCSYSSQSNWTSMSCANVCVPFRVGRHYHFSEKRYRAFLWFRRSMMVRLMFTDAFMMYRSQIWATGEIIFSIAIIGALSLMIAEEETTRRIEQHESSFAPTHGREMG